MKRILYTASALSLLAACQEVDIKPYSIDDCAVCFASASSQFSFKGITAPWDTVEVDVTLIGPTAPYDRALDIAVEEPTETAAAVQGADFSILSALVPADALKGTVVMSLRNFTGEESSLRVVLRVCDNQYFNLGYPAYVSTAVEWSKEYVRPKEAVWRYWYLYFCHGYSKALHEFIVNTLGTEAETYTGANSYAQADPTVTMKMPTWWYEASRTVYQAVKDHDTANPGSPLMHSSDFERYTSYKTAYGDGEKPETIPTILETLETL